MGAGAMGGGGELSKPPLPNSKSVPALHHGSSTIPHPSSANKSRSINNLIGSSTMMAGGSMNNFGMSSVAAASGASAATTADQGFYQNLSVYRAQNQSER